MSDMKVEVAIPHDLAIPEPDKESLKKGIYCRHTRSARQAYSDPR